VDNKVIERRIHCPFCGEAMIILADLSAGEQRYVEDCQICCQPMYIVTEITADEGIVLRVTCAQ